MNQPVETWGPTVYEQSHTVKLEGAEVSVQRGAPWGPRSRGYVVDAVQVTTQRIGSGEARTTVRLSCREIVGGLPGSRAVLYRENLTEVPAWLEDLVDRATPREGRP